MRELQPEIKRIKKEAKGNKQQESQMVMELYKERQINPFSSIGILIIQIPILFGLYAGLRRIIHDPHQVISFSYPFIRHLPWLQELAKDIHKFDHTLFGVVDLNRAALGKGTGIYWPAMLIVIGSAIAQYFQSKQLMPADKDARKLRDILKGAGKGEQADQSEVNAAIGRSTRYFIPLMIFFLTVNIAAALSLYWLVGGVVAYIQQSRILKQDETELEASTVTSVSNKQVIEGEVVEKPQKAEKAKSAAAKTGPKKSSAKKAKKRRKK
jgi:YidC/Oxa1 family membrane protein insertase